MNNPFRRKPNVYDDERDRLLTTLETLSPHTDEYAKTIQRLDQLDKIRNRTTEFKKVLIPSLTSIGAVTGIYALQQFAGVIVPRALENLRERQEQKKSQQELEN